MLVIIRGEKAFVAEDAGSIKVVLTSIHVSPPLVTAG